MSKLMVGVLMIAAVGMAMGMPRAAAQGAKVLFLSTSEGFAHGPIVQHDGKPSVADEVLGKLAKEMGATITCTKDASVINADNLKKYTLVIFYTQGDLTKPNKEGAPVMAPNGVTDLLDWIKAGGAFMGFHSASDTFHSQGDQVSPYIQMIGGEFRGHGGQFAGVVKVVDPAHPTMADVPDGWKFQDEWYLFRNFNAATMHVLALVDPGAEGKKQEMYNLSPYPGIWCSVYGKGRVYFSTLGHREDVWTNATFQKSVVDAAKWVLDEGDAKAEPNFDKVVPKEQPKAEAPKK